MLYQCYSLVFWAILGANAKMQFPTFSLLTSVAWMENPWLLYFQENQVPQKNMSWWFNCRVPKGGGVQGGGVTGEPKDY